MPPPLASLLDTARVLASATATATAAAVVTLAVGLVVTIGRRQPIAPDAPPPVAPRMLTDVAEPTETADPLLQPTAVPAADAVAIPWLPPSVRAHAARFNRAAAAHGVAADLLAIVALVESGGDTRAGSPAGAQGLMQVMPATARGIAAERGIVGFDVTQLHDPDVAVDFGAYYLAGILRTYGYADDGPDWNRSVDVAAAGYNGGPGQAANLRAGRGIPAETRAHVRWTGGMWRERRDAASPTYDAWLAAGGYVLVDKAAARLDGGW